MKVLITGFPVEIQESNEIRVFTDISEALQSVNRVPIRAKHLYITEDVLKLDTFAATVSELGRNLKYNDFFRFDGNVFFLVKEGNKDLKDKLEYYVDLNEFENWQIRYTTLSVDNIISFITDSAPLGSSIKKVKDIKIQTVKKFEEETRAAELAQSIRTDVTKLQEDDVDEIELDKIEPTIHSKRNVIKTDKISVVGNGDMDYYVTAGLIAQYASTLGRTVIIEDDFVFFKLTSVMDKIGMPVFIIPIEDILKQPEECFNKIEHSPARLILITGGYQMPLSYKVLKQYIVSALKGRVRYIISLSRDFVKGDINILNVPGVLEPCLKLLTGLDTATDGVVLKVIASTSTMINEIALPTSESIRGLIQIVREDWDVEKMEIRLIRITGATLGLDTTMSYLFS